MSAVRRGQWLVFKGLQEKGLAYDTNEISESVRNRTRKKILF